MRTFIAIDLPENVRAAIQQLMDRLRPLASGVSWSRAEGLHITLKFIGEIPDDQITVLQSRLAALPAAAPFRIAIGGHGFFPNIQRPKSLWLGVGAGPALAELARRIDSELSLLGIAPEAREYHPHLTLARMNTANVDGLQQQLEKLGALELGAFRADEYFLYRSQLAPGGSIYTKLFRVPLNATRVQP